MHETHEGNFTGTASSAIVRRAAQRRPGEVVRRLMYFLPVFLLPRLVHLWIGAFSWIRLMAEPAALRSSAIQSSAIQTSAIPADLAEDAGPAASAAQ
jgi:hypothetical protein